MDALRAKRHAFPFSVALHGSLCSPCEPFLQTAPAHCHATADAKALHPPPMRILRRFWPLLLLLAAIAAAWVGGLPQQLNWSALARHQVALTAWVTSPPVAAPAIYIVIYALAVALSFPESAVITVAGGLLFGTLAGGMLAVVGSGLGAIVL